MYKKKKSLITLKSHQQILRLISINFPQIHTLALTPNTETIIHTNVQKTNSVRQ